MPRAKKQHATRRKDGRYQCKYKGVFFYGRTEQEALSARDNYKSLSISPETFGAYAMRWLEAYKSHLTVKPYNQHVRMLNRFLSMHGDRLLTEITPTMISTFYQSMNGYSQSTINDARDTIKGVFKAALADGLIPRDPTMNIKPPKGQKGSHRALTPKEYTLIHAVQHRLRPCVMLMLYAGLRRGEVLALNIDNDIDFVNRRIYIREAVRFSGSGQQIITQPKTDAGIRVVPLIDGLAQELEGLHGLVCQSAKGEPMTETAFRRAWESYLVALSEYKNGSSKRWHKGPWKPVTIRPHDLRHSYCTMLYNAGIDIKTAMLWLGHADQTVTMQIYTHLTEQRRTEAEKAIKTAHNTLFGCQNGCQIETQAPEALKIQASQTVAQ